MGRFPAAAGGNDVLRRHGFGQPAARHAVRRRGVEAVEREKLPGRAIRGDGAVEKERAALRVGGAKFDIVADQDDGHALREQALQKLSQLSLEGRVQSARWLVEEQDIGPRKQDLCQRRALLLAAGKVVGVTVQQRFQLAECGDIGEHRFVGGDLGKVLAHGFLGKKRLHLLRQKRRFAGDADLSAIGLLQARQQPERGGLARAVAAEDGEKLAPPHRQLQPAQHVRRVRRIAEPRIRDGHDRLLRWCGQRALRHALEGVRGGKVCQPVPPLPHGDGTGKVVLHRRPHAHGGGHGAEQLVSRRAQLRAHGAGRAVREDRPAVQHNGAVGEGQRLLQPLLREQHRHSQLPVDPRERGEEVRRRDGVKLRGRLV